MFTMYADYAIDLIVDVAAIFLLAYVLYFRRHRRADLLLAYVSLNIGVFVAMSLLGKVRVDIALGFGLFAILSIIRLRSTSVTQQEVAYYFITLVMGLVNGLGLDDRRLIVLINAVLIVTMAVVDSKPLRERARRMDVHLDVVHSDDAALVADLERRLGGKGGRPGASWGGEGGAPRGKRHRLRGGAHDRRRALPGGVGSCRAAARGAPAGR